MADNERDLVLRLKAENSDLKAKLAESQVQLEKFKASNSGVAPGAAQAGAALSAEAQAAGAAGLGLSGMIVPLTAAAAVGGALVEVLGSLRDRGVDVGNAGNVATSALDLLARALGGSSKAAFDMERSFATAQTRLEGFTETAFSYRDASDLLVASGLEAEKVFRAQAEALPGLGQQINRAGVQFADLESRTRLATEAADDFVKNINKIRDVDPSKAKELAESFLVVAKEGKAGAAAAQELYEQAARLSEAAEPIAAAIREKFGKSAEEAAKAFGTLSASVQSIEVRFQELKDAGLTEGQAFDVLRGEIEKAGKASEIFVGIIAKLPPALRAQFEHVQALAEAHGKLESAIEKNREKTQASVNSFNDLSAAIDYGAQKYGSLQLAVESLKGPIEAQIKSIEKQRDSQGQLSVVNQTLLDTYQRWLAVTGVLDPNVDKLTDSIDKQAEKLLKLSGAVEQMAHQTFRFADGVEISNSKIENQRGQVDQLIESLNSLGRELYGVDAASDEAFATE